MGAIFDTVLCTATYKDGYRVKPGMTAGKMVFLLFHQTIAPGQCPGTGCVFKINQSQTLIYRFGKSGGAHVFDQFAILFGGDITK